MGQSGQRIKSGTSGLISDLLITELFLEKHHLSCLLLLLKKYLYMQNKGV